MSNYMMISTWKMSETGMRKAFLMMQENQSLEKCIMTHLQAIEDEECYCSVGFGGLPNKNGEVELDGAYMNGDDLGFGAVMALKGYRSPIEIAQHLSKRRVNCVLCGEGAQKYADEHQFEKRDNLTINAQNKYKEALNKALKPKAYDGHDTCCVIGSLHESIHCGVSTSGLFMKDAGRVGDSPIIGAGFYAQSHIGGACATGLGEDIMRRALSYEVVRLMEDGLTPMQACQRALSKHLKALQIRDEVGGISIIALNHKNEFGAATNEAYFPFVIGSEAKMQTYYVMKDRHEYFEADEEWLRIYEGD